VGKGWARGGFITSFNIYIYEAIFLHHKSMKKSELAVIFFGFLMFIKCLRSKKKSSVNYYIYIYIYIYI